MSIGKDLASRLNRRIRVERPLSGEAFDDAGSGEWGLVTETAAEVQDALPSRGERLADGINVASRPARVRMRFRTDIDASMRFVMGDRIMQIVSGPAEIGFREGLEFMVEDYSSAGSGA